MQTTISKSERQEQILMNLDKFGFLSRKHIQQLHRLGGNRNAQKVLKEMEPYLHCFRDGLDTVYYLNKAGRELIGSKKQVKRTMQTKHSLMRTDFFFHVGCPAQWKNEMKVAVGDKVLLITDAIFIKNYQNHFLEVDNTQTMSENRLKINKYKEVFDRGLFQKQFGYFPTLHIVTVNKSRMKRFSEMCEGLPARFYLIDEIK